MKKLYSRILLLVILAVASLGAGIGIAQIKKNYFDTKQIANPISQAPEIANIPESNSSAPVQPAESPTPAPAEQNTTTENSNTVTFAILGDTKVFNVSNPNGNLQKAVKSLATQKFDAAFIMGDLISNCDGGSTCEGKFNDWKKVVAPIYDKIHEVVGNHDRAGRGSSDAIWQKVFNLPTNGPSGFSEQVYSFSIGNSHFIVLDSEKPKEQIIDSTQRDWLDHDLATNKKEHNFVFFHEPAFQMAEKSKDGLDAKPDERDALWNILKKYKVDAVFNGHEHLFARKNIDGIQQIVVGDTDSTDDDFLGKGLSDYGYKGKSYAIVTVTGANVNIKLYTIEGKLLNSFDF